MFGKGLQQQAMGISQGAQPAQAPTPDQGNDDSGIQTMLSQMNQKIDLILTALKAETAEDQQEDQAQPAQPMH